MWDLALAQPVSQTGTELTVGMSAEAPKPERPHQFYINEHWDHCLDLTLRRVVYGGLAAGLAGLVLFRAAPQHALIVRVTCAAEGLPLPHKPAV